MFADGIEQARKQEFAGKIGARQKACHQISRASALPFLMGETRRIEEGAIGFVAVQKAFFKKAIEGGHYRGVREGPAEFGDDVTDAALLRWTREFPSIRTRECRGPRTGWGWHRDGCDF